ncbi:MAG: IS481 family transposase [Pseudomonadales bacterium]|nr:IS481 family transposase [Pseudomonadales bacterium]
MANRIPVETIILLKNSLDTIQPRSPERRKLIQDVADLHGVSVHTIWRALREQQMPSSARRSDAQKPRVLPGEEMQKFCEIIAAMQKRTRNKKGRHLSTTSCIRLLEGPGVITPDGLVQAAPGLLKRSTVNRHLKQMGFDQNTLAIDTPWVRFQAEHSNECWQFDFSPSDLKKLKVQNTKKTDDRTLMLASVVDDRSGVSYQEYHYILGEDVMTALRFLFAAMSPKPYKGSPFCGIPKILLMDNGPVSKSLVFKRVMKLLGVEIRLNAPASKEKRKIAARAKGKVERPFRSIKESLETLFWFHEPESLEEANEWLRAYLTKYNQGDHREENHSRMEDWVINAPKEGIRAMCSWEKFCSFVREPETRKVGGDACVSVEGVRFQLLPDMACQTVILLWGLLDNELFVEFNGEKSGPYYPCSGPIPLNTYRKHKKTSAEKRADRIDDLAKKLSIPRSALSSESTYSRNLLQSSQSINLDPPKEIPFEDVTPVGTRYFENRIDAKSAIAKMVGFPLCTLTPEQMEQVNLILQETLEIEPVLSRVRDYFNADKNKKGNPPCTEK